MGAHLALRRGGANASSGAGAGEIEHSRAFIHAIHLGPRIIAQERGQEAPIAIAEHQNPARAGGLRKESFPAALQRPAEARVLHPSVRAGNRIAVHTGYASQIEKRFEFVEETRPIFLFLGRDQRGRLGVRLHDVVGLHLAVRQQLAQARQ